MVRKGSRLETRRFEQIKGEGLCALHQNGSQGGMMKSFTTSDFYLSAFLIAKGLHFCDYKREGRRVIFYFPNIPDRENLTREYHDGGTVNVHDFVCSIKELKHIIHDLA